MLLLVIVEIGSRFNGRNVYDVVVEKFTFAVSSPWWVWVLVYCASYWLTEGGPHSSSVVIVDTWMRCMKNFRDGRYGTVSTLSLAGSTHVLGVATESARSWCSLFTSEQAKSPWVVSSAHRCRCVFVIYVLCFWATVCKALSPMLSDRCPVLSGPSV